jgi:hypothetical protein
VPIDLFAGIPVSDYAAALEWYQRVFDSSPALLPNDTEAVWEVAEHRFVYIVQRHDDAGHSVLLLFVEDLDARVAQMAERGIVPAAQETYSNGVRKVTYRDLDGNEVAFGGAPL